MAVESRLGPTLAKLIAAYLAVALLVELVFVMSNLDFHMGRGRGVAVIEHLLFVGLFGFLGALIGHNQPANPIGWVLAAIAILRQFGTLEAVVDVALADGTEVTWQLLMLRRVWPAALVFSLLAFVFVIFPTGRLPSRRWRPVVWIVGLVGLIDFSNTFVIALDARGLLASASSDSILVPIVDWGPMSLTLHPVQRPIFGPIQAFEILLVITLLACGTSIQARRFRRGSATERQQIKWLIPTLLLWAIGLLLTAPPVEMSFERVPLFILPLPISITFALLRYRTYDIDRIVSAALVYGAMTVAIFLIYGSVAVGLGLAAGARFPIEIAILLTVVVTVSFQPIRERLQVLADRWVYGEQPNPLQAIKAIDQHVGVSTAAALARLLADTIRNTARLRWVSVSISPSEEQTSGAKREQAVANFEIAHDGEHFGLIACGPKVKGRFEAADEDLVRALATQVALTLANTKIAGRLVQAQEAERRKIERDIHDGAQQQLVALMAKLAMVRAEFRRKGLVEPGLDELQTDTARILEDLRNLAQGIHPTILADGGLIEAIEDRCKRLPIEVTVDWSPDLRDKRFDDDIEGACYFFIAEGMTNVLKHAAAKSAGVEVTQENGHLTLTVRDDGVGFAIGSAELHGLEGLRDRFRALGGSVSVHSDPSHGTVLEGRVPVIRP